MKRFLLAVCCWMLAASAFGARTDDPSLEYEDVWFRCLYQYAYTDFEEDQQVLLHRDRSIVLALNGRTQCYQFCAQDGNGVEHFGPREALTWSPEMEIYLNDDGRVAYTAGFYYLAFEQKQGVDVFTRSTCEMMETEPAVERVSYSDAGFFVWEDDPDADGYDFSDEEALWNDLFEEDPPAPKPTTADYIKYILFAILPAVLLLVFILWRDRLRPEPVKELLIAIGLGALTIPMAIWLETWISGTRLVPEYVATWGDSFRLAFFGAAIPEELCKMLVLVAFFLWRRRQNEFMDGIVYAVCIGLAFAAIENATYLIAASEDFRVLYYGPVYVWSLGTSRALLAVPGHFGFAVLMGYFYSLFLFKKERRGLWFALAFLVPVAFHGIYDTFAFKHSPGSDWYFVEAFFFFGLFFMMSNLCVKAIRVTLKRDDEKFAEELSKS